MAERISGPFYELARNVVAALEAWEPDDNDTADDQEIPSADGILKSGLEVDLEELIGRFVYEFQRTTVESVEGTVRFVIYQTRLYDHSVADEPDAPEIKVEYVEEVLKVCFNPDHPAKRPRGQEIEAPEDPLRQSDWHR